MNFFKKQIKDHQIIVQEKIYDNLSYQIINKYLPSFSYPYTTSSLNYYKINIILNDILLNSRKNILEFGSGLSTIVIGNFIRNENLECRLISFEHDPFFYEMQMENISSSGLSDYVQICLAPVKTQNFSSYTCEWYDKQIFQGAIQNNKYDVIIVDGPPAYMEAKSLNRYPSIPMTLNHLNDSFSIYLDDSNRKGEKFIMKKWFEEFNIAFRQIGPTFNHSVKGEFINSYI